MTAIANALAELVARTPRLAEAWLTGERVGWSGSLETPAGDVDVKLWAPLWLGHEHAGSAYSDEEPEKWESLVDEDGMLDEDLFEDHFNALMTRFEASAESSEEVLAIAEMLVEHTAMEFGATIVSLSPEEMSEVLFKAVPARVTIDPGAAPVIIATMRALLAFAERELGSTTAAECLAALSPSSADRLARELADERNFGEAKSLYLQGARAGYDMTSERGIAAFIDSLGPAALGAKKKAKAPKAKASKAKASKAKAPKAKTKTKTKTKTTKKTKTKPTAKPAKKR
jgi:hypothetical protein